LSFTQSNEAIFQMLQNIIIHWLVKAVIQTYGDVKSTP